MSPLRFRYQTIEFGNTDIHLRTLRDTQQYSDDNNIALDLGITSATWPLFGIVWNSSQVLAHLMHDFDIEGKRILEVGCGIALSSLVLNSRMANITATDYHPEVASFLNENVKLNGGEPIPFVRSDWKDKNTTLGKFDLVIGSDLLYEPNHADLLSSFIDQHTKPVCEVIIIDPNRSQRTQFSRKMVSLNYTYSQKRVENTEYLEEPYKGKIMRYVR